MNKEMNDVTYEIQHGKIGTLKIADDVVAMIAGIAATEIDGVTAMAGNLTSEIMSKVGVKNLTKGVKVEIFGGRVKVEVAIEMRYGYNVISTGKKVQDKVKLAIENMTGLIVDDVNVRIVSIYMDKESSK